MGKTIFKNFYNLPERQQRGLVEYGFDPLRHDGKWMIESELKNYPNAIAVMKSYGLESKATIPRILNTNFVFSINPRMNFFVVIFYKDPRFKELVRKDWF